MGNYIVETTKNINEKVSELKEQIDLQKRLKDVIIGCKVFLVILSISSLVHVLSLDIKNQNTFFVYWILIDCIIVCFESPIYYLMEYQR